MSALDKAREKLDAARKSATAQRAKQEVTRRMDVAAAGAFGAVIGAAERAGKRLPRLVQAVPLPAKAQWALLTAYVADTQSGETRVWMHRAAVSLAAIGGYESGVAGAIVQGAE